MPAANSTPSTRTRLLDAALALTAEGGLEACTHRAVEERAGTTHGSTTYHFKTRDGLIEAMLERQMELEMASLSRVAEQIPGWPLPAPDLDPAQLAPLITEVTNGFLTNRQAALARYELFLYAARRPHLQGRIAQMRQHYVDLTAAALRPAGAADPELSARYLAAALDGILLHQVSAPDRGVEDSAGAWLSALAAQAAAFRPSDR